MTPENAGAFLKKYGGIETVPVNELHSGIKIGIFGPGGIGKTTLAATVCDSEYGAPALYLDARGNPHVVSSYGDKIQVLPVSSFKDVERVRQDLLRDKDMPFKSVIIDNLSELMSLDLRDRYGANTDIVWTMHSATTADILGLVRNWCDLADSALALNVIFAMWETSEVRKVRSTEVTRSELSFNKALQAQVPGILSWLGRLYIAEERAPYARVLDFRPIETMHVAKWQVDPNDPRTAQLPMEMYNPSLASILDTVIGGKPWPTERHARPGSKASN